MCDAAEEFFVSNNGDVLSVLLGYWVLLCDECNDGFQVF